MEMGGGLCQPAKRICVRAFEMESGLWGSGLWRKLHYPQARVDLCFQPVADILLGHPEVVAVLFVVAVHAIIDVAPSDLLDAFLVLLFAVVMHLPDLLHQFDVRLFEYVIVLFVDHEQNSGSQLEYLQPSLVDGRSQV